jgi:hypothetical protein
MTMTAIEVAYALNVAATNIAFGRYLEPATGEWVDIGVSGNRAFSVT